MNTNRSNNRRRGRGNNRGPGGGNQGNRVDSRARGNAPQMLDKYKKLAHDASLNGDRVQTEYYLQFADHYFRVIADNKTQKDDHRPRRDNERDQDSDNSDDEDDNNNDNNGSGYNDAPQGRGRGRRNEPNRNSEGDSGSEGDDISDEESNPFVREAKPKRAPRARKKPEAEGSGIDAGALPPSIRSESDSGRDDDTEEEAPKPRRRAARRPRSTDGDDETLEAVG